MKIKYLIIIWLVQYLTFDIEAQTACDFINKIQAYQDSVKLKVKFMDDFELPVVDITNFDIHVYMKMFNKLRLDSGKVCCLTNNYEPYDGKPLLYVKSINFNEAEFISERINKEYNRIDSTVSQLKIKYQKENLPAERINRMIARFENLKKCYNSHYALLSYASDSANLACNNLTPEDSPDGYLQYLFFNQMGEQFALFWHSYYGEKSVVCCKDNITYYLDYYSKRKDSFVIQEDKIRELADLDLPVKVEMEGMKCRITWYEIYTHSGIYRKTYSIEREHPFRIEKVSEQKMADISITFIY